MKKPTVSRDTRALAKSKKQGVFVVFIERDNGYSSHAEGPLRPDKEAHLWAAMWFASSDRSWDDCLSSAQEAVEKSKRAGGQKE